MSPPPPKSNLALSSRLLFSAQAFNCSHFLWFPGREVGKSPPPPPLPLPCVDVALLKHVRKMGVKTVSSSVCPHFTPALDALKARGAARNPRPPSLPSFGDQHSRWDRSPLFAPDAKVCLPFHCWEVLDLSEQQPA